MARRPNLFLEVCGLVGPAAQPIDPRDGWPGIAQIASSDSARNVAIHVSRVSPHARRPYEMRFQNPADARAVQHPVGAVPILVGLAAVNGRAILVAVDGRSRVGRPARFSILFNVSALQEAAISGWSEYRSSTGEHIFAMHPRLLPAFVEALGHGVLVDQAAIADAAAASGLAQGDDEEAAERARNMVSRLVRRAAFGREVCAAYESKCAMCGLSLGLPEGAHIYPASAPQSSDRIWNGLALCRNHHRIFDLHRVWVSPADGGIRWHPEILERAAAEPIIANFVDNTRTHIAMPPRAAHRPRQQMFEMRYEYVGPSYGWVD